MTHDHLSRGNLLLQQNRYEEAEVYFKQAIAAEPGNALAYAELATALVEQEGRKKDGLEAIDRAIQLEPEVDFFHARRSLILSRLNRDKEALAAADTAIGLDPDHSLNYAVKGQALAGLQRWADAEEQCRKALSLDADDGFASNLLANVLRLQGKQGESQVAAEKLLADDPEDPYAHFNAGWAALQRHDHQEAEKHFREALRLDPDFDPARAGLLESFKARSFFYRTYLRYGFFMQRFTGGMQWAIIIGILIAYNFGRRLLSAIHPLAGLALVVLYLGFVLWVFLAPGIGNFLVLLDRSARHALKRGEAWQGIFAGGLFFVGLLILAVSAATSYSPAMVLGGALAIGAVPAAMTFGNESRKGRTVFGAIMLFIYAAGLIVFLVEMARHPAAFTGRSNSAIGFGILAGIACTWLANVPALRQDDSG